MVRWSVSFSAPNFGSHFVVSMEVRNEEISWGCCVFLFVSLSKYMKLDLETTLHFVF